MFQAVMSYLVGPLTILFLVLGGVNMLDWGCTSKSRETGVPYPVALVVGIVIFLLSLVVSAGISQVIYENTPKLNLPKITVTITPH